MSNIFSALEDMERFATGPCLAVIRDRQGVDSEYIRGNSVEELRDTFRTMQKMGEFFAVDHEYIIYDHGEEVERIPIDASRD